MVVFVVCFHTGQIVISSIQVEISHFPNLPNQTHQHDSLLLNTTSLPPRPTRHNTTLTHSPIQSSTAVVHRYPRMRTRRLTSGHVICAFILACGRGAFLQLQRAQALSLIQAGIVQDTDSLDASSLCLFQDIPALPSQKEKEKKKKKSGWHNNKSGVKQSIAKLENRPLP